MKSKAGQFQRISLCADGEMPNGMRRDFNYKNDEKSQEARKKSSCIRKTTQQYKQLGAMRAPRGLHQILIDDRDVQCIKLHF